MFTLFILPLLLFIPFFTIGGDTTKSYSGYVDCSITNLSGCFFNIFNFFGLEKKQSKQPARIYDNYAGSPVPSQTAQEASCGGQRRKQCPSGYVCNYKTDNP